MRQKSTSSRPPRTSRMQATSHIPLLDKWKKQATIGGRCDCLARFARFTKRATPGPALLAFAATFRERPVPLRLPRSRPSCSACRWTCDGAWDRREHNPASRGSCKYTSLLPVLSCPPWEGNVVRCVLTGDTKLAVRSSSTDHGEKTMGSGTRATNFGSQACPRCKAPAGSRSRPTGRATCRCSPGHPSSTVAICS